MKNFDPPAAARLLRAIEKKTDEEAASLVAGGTGPTAERDGTDLLGWTVVRRLSATLKALLDGGLDPNVRVRIDVTEVRLHEITKLKASVFQRMRELDAGAAQRTELRGQLAWLSRQRLALLERPRIGQNSLREVSLLALAFALDAGELADLLLAAGAEEALFEEALPLAPEVSAGQVCDRSEDGQWRVLDDEVNGKDEDPDLDWHELPNPPGLSTKEREHYHPLAVRARLVVAASSTPFRALVEEMVGVCDAAPEVWEEGGAIDLPFASGSPGERLGLPHIQKIAARAKAMAVRSGSQGHRLTLLPTSDLLEAIVAFDIAGPNVDISDEQILSFVKRHPLLVTRLRHDLIVGRLQRPAEDPEAVALKLFRLCPDLVDQGLGCVDTLIAHVRHRSELYLWWD